MTVDSCCCRLPADTVVVVVIITLGDCLRLILALGILATVWRLFAVAWTHTTTHCCVNSAERAALDASARDAVLAPGAALDRLAVGDGLLAAHVQRRSAHGQPRQQRPFGEPNPLL